MQESTPSSASTAPARIRARHLQLLLGVAAAGLLFGLPHSPAESLGGVRRQPADRTGQSWTADEARAHADRFNDEALWNLAFLNADTANDQANLADRASLPFSRMAFNAPDYELTGRVMPGLTTSPLAVAAPMAGLYVGVHQTLALKDVPEGKSWHDVVVTEPVLALVASGPAPIHNTDSVALSRSHPHYLFQGAMASKHGEIRWAALRMADGTELAIVNGRVLDLAQGNLILVRQHEDGSIRIHQHNTRVQPARGEDLRKSIPALIQQPELQRTLGNG